ncbi:MAG: hypothetical protein ACE5GV_03700 [Candidatus Scalindua sp.]
MIGPVVFLAKRISGHNGYRYCAFPLSILSYDKNSREKINYDRFACLVGILEWVVVRLAESRS